MHANSCQNVVNLLSLCHEHDFRGLGEIWQFSLLKRDFFCFLFEIGSQWVSMECSPVPDTFLEIPLMCAASQTRRSSRRRQQGHLGKPRGILAPRVQAVGPEHFGVVAVDCAKARSKWMLTDFYGRVVVPPTVVEHNRAAFDHMLVVIRQSTATHKLKDVVVAVERTGRYHLPVQRASLAVVSTLASSIRRSPPTSARPLPTTTRRTTPTWRESSARQSMASVFKSSHWMKSTELVSARRSHTRCAGGLPMAALVWSGPPSLAW